MSVASRFETFLGNLSLSSAQREDAQTKYNGVCSKLHSHYYGTTYDGSTKLLIGSYGKRINIRPPRDVDVLFIMPYAKYTQYNSQQGNGQSQLLQDIRSALMEKYTYVNIRGDGFVVVVPFEGGHHVEVLPGWLSTNNKYLIPDTHNGGKWTVTDPPAEIANLDASDRRSNGNTRNLIKMMKAWQEYCSVPIKSLSIELRVISFMKNWQYYSNGTMYYDWMARDFFRELLNYVNGNCQIPGIEEKVYYGDEWKSKAESALARAVKACEYESAKKEDDATLEWKKIFGDDFYF
jgi:hypothetical protein